MHCSKCPRPASIQQVAPGIQGPLTAAKTQSGKLRHLRLTGASQPSSGLDSSLTALPFHSFTPVVTFSREVPRYTQMGGRHKYTGHVSSLSL